MIFVCKGESTGFAENMYRRERELLTALFLKWREHVYTVEENPDIRWISFKSSPLLVLTSSTPAEMSDGGISSCAI